MNRFVTAVTSLDVDTVRQLVKESKWQDSKSFLIVFLTLRPLRVLSETKMVSRRARRGRGAM